MRMSLRRVCGHTGDLRRVSNVAGRLCRREQERLPRGPLIGRAHRRACYSISAVLGFLIIDTVAAMRIRLLAEVVTVGLTSHDGVRTDGDPMAVEPECSSEDKFPQV